MNVDTGEKHNLKPPAADSNRRNISLSALNAPFRIVLPVLLTVALFVGTIFGLILPQYKKNLLSDRREMIRELTQSAWSIIDSHHRQELIGNLSRRSALSRLFHL